MVVVFAGGPDQHSQARWRQRDSAADRLPLPSPLPAGGSTQRQVAAGSGLAAGSAMRLRDSRPKASLQSQSFLSLGGSQEYAEAEVAGIVLAHAQTGTLFEFLSAGMNALQRGGALGVPPRACLCFSPDSCFQALRAAGEAAAVAAQASGKVEFDSRQRFDALCYTAHSQARARGSFPRHRSGQSCYPCVQR